MSFEASAQRLAELYSAALSGNPNLKSREFDVERARAESDGVRSRLLPQVSAYGTWSRNDYRDALVGDQHYNGERANISLRQALYDPISSRRLGAAQATIQQREHEAVLIRLALLEEVLDRFLQALAAQDELAWLDAETQAAGRQVDRLRAMRERQMAKVTDLAEADAYAQTLVTRTIDARNQHAVALARLAEVCGVDVRQVPPLSRVSFDRLAGNQQEWVANAQRNYPRLLALVEALDAARRSVEASRAEYLPQLAASLSHTYSDQGYDNRRQPTYRVTSAGVEVRVPIYEGGRSDASVREATARLGVAQQQLESARREVDRETTTIWLSAQANHARISSTDAEVRALEQTVKAQEIGLDLGASRITDVLDARRRLLRARVDQAKARYDYLRDIVALKIRTGEVTETDVASWDGWFGPIAR
ncbi:MAG: TolC family protein [Proteobacteria bacterium]|nr:TolC family protein [Pseudomonadota bacterium]